jgi:methionyl-tRNA synthetase
MLGFDVKFVSGTDEHGQKIQESANAAGISPKEFVDNISSLFRSLLKEINVQNDDFIRTTEIRHKNAVDYFWNTLKNNGHIYLGEYSGWYDVRNEAFFAEEELVDGKSPLGGDVRYVTEPCYFFRLSAFQDKLLDLYKEREDFVCPKKRFNEVISFVYGGLNDLAISRTTFSWGIPVKDDPKHVVYVWLDALVNYLTVNNYPNNLDQNNDKYWQNVVHFIGKEIVKFHAVYWPAFLIGAGIEVPKQIVSHGWWLSEGEKMSKSVGNVVDPLKYVKSFGSDALRYFLMREISFGEDGNFALSSFINRYNSFLANSYGNLCKRVLSFIHKNCSGAVQKPRTLYPQDVEFKENSINSLAEALKHIEAYEFHKYIERVEHAVALANQYVDYQKPWSLKGVDNSRVSGVLYIVVEVLYHITNLLYPVIPKASSKVLNYIKIDSNPLINLSKSIPAEIFVENPDVLFQRIEHGDIEINSLYDT